MDIINLLAIIIGPIAAVIVGQVLQRRKELRDDKMKIFKTLMTSRIYPWTPDMVDALNTIDIVFARDKKVRTAWKDLFDKYSVANPDEAHLVKIRNAQYKLLEAIAESVGYKKLISWDVIQNPYMPRGMQESLDAQNRNQQLYSELMGSIKENMPSK